MARPLKTWQATFDQRALPCTAGAAARPFRGARPLPHKNRVRLNLRAIARPLKTCQATFDQRASPFVGAASRRERAAKQPQDFSSAADTAGVAAQPFRGARPFPHKNRVRLNLRAIARPLKTCQATFDQRARPCVGAASRRERVAKQPQGFSSAADPAGAAAQPFRGTRPLLHKNRVRLNLRAIARPLKTCQATFDQRARPCVGAASRRERVAKQPQGFSSATDPAGAAAQPFRGTRPLLHKNRVRLNLRAIARPLKTCQATFDQRAPPCVGAALCRERAAKQPQDFSSAADTAGVAAQPFRGARPLPHKNRVRLNLRAIARPLKTCQATFDQRAPPCVGAASRRERAAKQPQDFSRAADPAGAAAQPFRGARPLLHKNRVRLNLRAIARPLKTCQATFDQRAPPCVGAALRRERAAKQPQDFSSAADTAGAATQPFRGTRPLLHKSSAPSSSGGG
ncbi:hypothetical protein GLGCALEP_01688 [Pseudomonas sp. MM221]|nr:hypothetical protein DBADOPDK_01646 [Pseudomonas sp. MM223]CAI3797360.1 hypothetical protein GLGCALEP_01688 [Pseudomonas sp. MM221]